MEEAAIHGSAVQNRHSSAVGIGENCLGAEFGRNLLEAICDFGERFVPGNALPAWGGSQTHPNAFGGYSPHGIEDAVWRVHAIQILRYFGAKKAAGDRVIGVPLNLCGSSVFDRDENPTGVGAVVGTGRMHHCLHSLKIIKPISSWVPHGPPHCVTPRAVRLDIGRAFRI